MQDAQMDESLYKTPNASNILLDETVTKDTSGEGKAMDIDFDAPPRDDGFGEGLDDFGMFENVWMNMVNYYLYSV